ncbi:hypothetical protein [Saccharothrix sp. Mg75]|uniref:hypothetical protein n=1 Tax=Saccharothrix sp. Mg75 TaxID=3445357 RepID=UPI003EEA90E2
MTSVATTTENALTRITEVHTLGPAGTNCEQAARVWLANRGVEGEVRLHRTLETAVEEMSYDGTHALLGCVVYPDLHTLVFSNLHRLVLADMFIMPTFNMLLAAREQREPATVSTHPAPQHLVPEGMTRVITTSNAQAASDCANGLTDGCITTLPAAREHDLVVLRDYGPVPMGFTIHVPVGTAG